MKRAQRRKRGREPGGIALEARREVLDEVDLVDIAACDRGTHLADSSAVVVRRPRRVPLPDAERQTRRTPVFVRGPNSGRSNGQPARLHRRGPGLAPERLPQAVAEVDVGNQPVAQPAGQILLERLERPSGCQSSSTDGLCGVPQKTHAQLEIAHRDPLVRGVDQPRGGLGVQSARREEPIGNGPECLPQPM